ncbi:Fibrous sheath-interacting protein 2 like protein [Argiope bruennichi]|uniref:Fibrous sheath-interacting protein 2 like protein n=1 Tax=Argiope bruennichi TaxID=94029 RepID=A0A8T0EF50_ARGBR|nr:Fibrous sheath-interacting protein 2 like protein [Argiope bruennichi]
MDPELLALPRTPASEKTPVPPPKSLPIDDLPMWRKIPFDAKFPVPKLPERDTQLCTAKVGETLFHTYPGKKFDLTGTEKNNIPFLSYNSLNDPYLRYYFRSSPSYKDLVSKGLITPDGKVKADITEYNQYRMYLHHMWAMEIHQLRKNQEAEEEKRLQTLLKAVEEEDSICKNIIDNQDIINTDIVMEKLAAKLEASDFSAEYSENPLIRSLINWKQYQKILEKMRLRWEKLRENSRNCYNRVIKLQEKQKEKQRILCEKRQNLYKSMWNRHKHEISQRTLKQYQKVYPHKERSISPDTAIQDTSGISSRSGQYPKLEVLSPEKYRKSSFSSSDFRYSQANDSYEWEDSIDSIKMKETESFFKRPYPSSPDEGSYFDTRTSTNDGQANVVSEIASGIVESVKKKIRLAHMSSSSSNEETDVSDKFYTDKKRSPFQKFSSTDNDFLDSSLETFEGNKKIKPSKQQGMKKRQKIKGKSLKSKLLSPYLGGTESSANGIANKERLYEQQHMKVSKEPSRDKRDIRTLKRYSSLDADDSSILLKYLYGLPGSAEDTKKIPSSDTDQFKEQQKTQPESQFSIESTDLSKSSRTDKETDIYDKQHRKLKDRKNLQEEAYSLDEELRNTDSETITDIKSFKKVTPVKKQNKDIFQTASEGIQMKRHLQPDIKTKITEPNKRRTPQQARELSENERQSEVSKLNKDHIPKTKQPVDIEKDLKSQGLKKDSVGKTEIKSKSPKTDMYEHGKAKMATSKDLTPEKMLKSTRQADEKMKYSKGESKIPSKEDGQHKKEISTEKEKNKDSEEKIRKQDNDSEKLKRKEKFPLKGDHKSEFHEDLDSVSETNKSKESSSDISSTDNSITDKKTEPSLKTKKKECFDDVIASKELKTKFKKGQIRPAEITQLSNKENDMSLKVKDVLKRAPKSEHRKDKIKDSKPSSSEESRSESPFKVEKDILQSETKKNQYAKDDRKSKELTVKRKIEGRIKSPSEFKQESDSSKVKVHEKDKLKLKDTFKTSPKSERNDNGNKDIKTTIRKAIHQKTPPKTKDSEISSIPKTTEVYKKTRISKRVSPKGKSEPKSTRHDTDSEKDEIKAKDEFLYSPGCEFHKEVGKDPETCSSKEDIPEISLTDIHSMTQEEVFPHAMMKKKKFQSEKISEELPIKDKIKERGTIPSYDKKITKEGEMKLRTKDILKRTSEDSSKDSEISPREEYITEPSWMDVSSIDKKRVISPLKKKREDLRDGKISKTLPIKEKSKGQENIPRSDESSEEQFDIRTRTKDELEGVLKHEHRRDIDEDSDVRSVEDASIYYDSNHHPKVAITEKSPKLGDFFKDAYQDRKRKVDEEFNSYIASRRDANRLDKENQLPKSPTGIKGFFRKDIRSEDLKKDNETDKKTYPDLGERPNGRDSKPICSPEIWKETTQQKSKQAEKYFFLQKQKLFSHDLQKKSPGLKKRHESKIDVYKDIIELDEERSPEISKSPQKMKENLQNYFLFQQRPLRKRDQDDGISSSDFDWKREEDEIDAVVHSKKDSLGHSQGSLEIKKALHSYSFLFHKPRFCKAYNREDKFKSFAEQYDAKEKDRHTDKEESSDILRSFKKIHDERKRKLREDFNLYVLSKRNVYDNTHDLESDLAEKSHKLDDYFKEAYQERKRKIDEEFNRYIVSRRDEKHSDTINLLLEIPEATRDFSKSDIKTDHKTEEIDIDNKAPKERAVIGKVREVYIDQLGKIQKPKEDKRVLELDEAVIKENNMPRKLTEIEAQEITKVIDDKEMKEQKFKTERYVESIEAPIEQKEKDGFKEMKLRHTKDKIKKEDEKQKAEIADKSTEDSKENYGYAETKLEQMEDEPEMKKISEEQDDRAFRKYITFPDVSRLKSEASPLYDETEDEFSKGSSYEDSIDDIIEKFKSKIPEIAPDDEVNFEYEEVQKVFGDKMFAGSESIKYIKTDEEENYEEKHKPVRKKDLKITQTKLEWSQPLKVTPERVQKIKSDLEVCKKEFIQDPKYFETISAPEDDDKTKSKNEIHQLILDKALGTDIIDRKALEEKMLPKSKKLHTSVLKSPEKIEIKRQKKFIYKINEKKYLYFTRISIPVDQTTSFSLSKELDSKDSSTLATPTDISIFSGIPDPSILDVKRNGNKGKQYEVFILKNASVEDEKSTSFSSPEKEHSKKVLDDLEFIESTDVSVVDHSNKFETADSFSTANLISHITKEARGLEYVCTMSEPLIKLSDNVYISPNETSFGKRVSHILPEIKTLSEQDPNLKDVENQLIHGLQKLLNSTAPPRCDLEQAEEQQCSEFYAVCSSDESIKQKPTQLESIMKGSLFDVENRENVLNTTKDFLFVAPSQKTIQGLEVVDENLDRFITNFQNPLKKPIITLSSPTKESYSSSSENDEISKHSYFPISLPDAYFGSTRKILLDHIHVQTLEETDLTKEENTFDEISRMFEVSTAEQKYHSLKKTLPFLKPMLSELEKGREDIPFAISLPDSYYESGSENDSITRYSSSSFSIADNKTKILGVNEEISEMEDVSERKQQFHALAKFLPPTRAKDIMTITELKDNILETSEKRQKYHNLKKILPPSLSGTALIKLESNLLQPVCADNELINIMLPDAYFGTASSDYLLELHLSDEEMNAMKKAQKYHTFQKILPPPKPAITSDAEFKNMINQFSSDNENISLPDAYFATEDEKDFPFKVYQSSHSKNKSYHKEKSKVDSKHSVEGQKYHVLKKNLPPSKFETSKDRKNISDDSIEIGLIRLPNAFYETGNESSITFSKDSVFYETQEVDVSSNVIRISTDNQEYYHLTKFLPPMKPKSGITAADMIAKNIPLQHASKFHIISPKFSFLEAKELVHLGPRKVSEVKPIAETPIRLIHDKHHQKVETLKFSQDFANVLQHLLNEQQPSSVEDISILKQKPMSIEITGELQNLLKTLQNRLLEPFKESRKENRVHSIAPAFGTSYENQTWDSALDSESYTLLVDATKTDPVILIINKSSDPNTIIELNITEFLKPYLQQSLDASGLENPCTPILERQPPKSSETEVVPPSNFDKLEVLEKPHSTKTETLAPNSKVHLQNSAPVIIKTISAEMDDTFSKKIQDKDFPNKEKLEDLIESIKEITAKRVIHKTLPRRRVVKPEPGARNSNQLLWDAQNFQHYEVDSNKTSVCGHSRDKSFNDESTDQEDSEEELEKIHILKSGKEGICKDENQKYEMQSKTLYEFLDKSHRLPADKSSGTIPIENLPQIDDEGRQEVLWSQGPSTSYIDVQHTPEELQLLIPENPDNRRRGISAILNKINDAISRIESFDRNKIKSRRRKKKSKTERKAVKGIFKTDSILDETTVAVESDTEGNDSS